MGDVAFTLELSRQPGQVVLRLSGEFDLACELELERSLESAFDANSTLVVDMSEASFVSVGVLTRLVLAGRRFNSAQLRSPAPVVERVLRLLGLDDSIEIGSRSATENCLDHGGDGMPTVT